MADEKQEMLDNLILEVLAAKTDEQRLNDLVNSHKQWILRCASDTTHRYITDSDDEWSIALLAFTEAVKSYEEGKGSFLALANVVIRRRLLDYLRSEGRHSSEISVAPVAFGEDISEEEASGINLQVHEQIAEESLEQSNDDIASRTRAEIASMQKTLWKYGFSFFDLADCSPKAEKTKRGCAFAVRVLLEEEEMMESVRHTRTLPMKDLSAKSGVARKILDRHRRYIIAAAEILAGDYPILSAYVSFIKTIQ